MKATLRLSDYLMQTNITNSEMVSDLPMTSWASH